MNRTFTADPTALENNGKKILENSEAFKTSVQAIYNTVENMINNDYISKEAIEIGKSIENCRSDMDTLAKTIEAYGIFLQKSAKIVRNGQEQIIDNVKY